MAKSRVSDRTVTKTYVLANELAEFPRVDDTAHVDLGYSPEYLERRHRAPRPMGLFR